METGCVLCEVETNTEKKSDHINITVVGDCLSIYEINKRNKNSRTLQDIDYDRP